MQMTFRKNMNGIGKSRIDGIETSCMNNINLALKTVINVETPILVVISHTSAKAAARKIRGGRVRVMKVLAYMNAARWSSMSTSDREEAV